MTRGARRIIRVLAVLSVPVWLSACSHFIVVHTPAPEPPVQSGLLQVGAAKVDITPIPGIPMGGFSAFGKVSRGVWNRLHARAIYIEDPDGNPVVLVSVDLLQMPNGLADRIAQRLAADTDLDHIGREHLVLSATHTHQGPANYFTSAMETSLFSPAPIAGFDVDLFDFLVARIVSSIRAAHEGKQAATMAVNHANDGNAADNVLQHAFRNRSLTAFRLNPESSQFIGAASPLLAGCTIFPEIGPEADPDMCKAVDPNVEILSFTAGGKTLAVAAFLATHPTVMPGQMEVYSGDLFGVTANLLERGQVAQPGCPSAADEPVVALFNGAQGDVSPTWDEDRRDRDELLDLAESLAHKICALMPGAIANTVTVQSRFRIVDDLAGRSFVESTASGGFERKTDPSPVPGEAKLGGAEDGRTSLYHAGWREGVRAPARGENGAKAPAVGPLGPLAFQLSPPPSRAPVGVFRIGSIGIASLPGEFTTMMGRRIRDRVGAQLGLSRVLVAGLSNGYIDYVTTPEEYDAQHFEGASTFYGDATGPYLAHVAEGLASDLTGPLDDALRWPRTYRVSATRRFVPSDAGGPPYRVDDGLAPIVVDRVPVGARAHPRRDFPAFCFYDAIPRLAPIPDPASTTDCRRTTPHVSVQDDSTSTDVADSGGLDLVTVMVGVGQDRTEWCSIWLVPEELRTRTNDFRFRAERIRGAAVASLAFVPDEVFAGGTPFLDRRGTADLVGPSGSGTYDECQDVPAFP